jgi:hypothetical protein
VISLITQFLAWHAVEYDTIVHEVSFYFMRLQMGGGMAHGDARAEYAAYVGLCR